jgi:glycosyltransferase involved in cell wall biosynthesis
MPQPPFTGGIRSFLHSLSQSRVLADYGVDFLDNDIPDKVREKKCRLFFTLRSLASLLAKLLTFRYRLVHIHCSDRLSFYEKSAFMLCCRCFAARTVMHIHTGRFPGFYEQSGCKVLVRFLLNRATAIITTSRETRQFFQQTCKSQVFQVPNCVSPIFFDLEPLPQQERRDILFLGYINPAKGIFELLQAVKLLRKLGHDNRVLLVGSEQIPGSVDRVRHFISGEGIKGVELGGEATPEEVAGYCRSSAIFVLPSYSEGLPISMLEAMASGLPVVASRVGGIPEIVTEEENGLLVAPRDVEGLARALIRLLEDPGLCLRMGHNNRKKVRNTFSADHTAEKIVEIYNKILGRT